MSMSNIDKIYHSGLCLGCGLCAAVANSSESSEQDVEMVLTEQGFFKPVVRNQRAIFALKVIDRICPGRNITVKPNSSFNNSIWGNVIECHEGRFDDDEVVYESSSGGVISGIGICALDSGFASAVLHVGFEASDYRSNRLKMSRTRNEIVANSASRYAPAIIFDQLINYLKSSGDTFCFIGKPCDVAALSNFLLLYPEYNDRFVLTVALVCAGMPSFNATEEAVDYFEGVKKPVVGLRYRGKGWPGYFQFDDATGKNFLMSYNDSWGKIFNQHLHMRCKICPDGIGMSADISVGDSWDTEDGYPDFSEKIGRSLLFVRSERGKRFLDLNRRRFLLSPLDIDRIKYIQPFQYMRRKFAGVRYCAYSLVYPLMIRFTGVLKFSFLRRKDLWKIQKEFRGTFKRTLSYKRKNCSREN